MSVIDEVKQKTDIVEVISQYTSLTKAGRTLRGLCPFHSEKHGSFFVYPEQQSWHCFGACSTGGDVFSFIMKKENLDFGEALRLLAERAGVELPTITEPGVKKDEKERLYQINDAAAQYFHNLLLNSKPGEKARQYVERRGISPESTAQFRLGYSPNSWDELGKHLTDIGYTRKELLDAGLIIEGEEGETHDRFRNRLMFPLCDVRGHVTGFGARALDDSMPKYLNSPQTIVFDKSSTIYGINLAAPEIRAKDSVVIVEGYMDVITAHQHGFTNVIAAMGTAVTEAQVSALKRLSRNIVLALDADNAGEEAMLRCVGYENILDSEMKVITLPEGKDPDDVIREHEKLWEKLLGESLPIIDYTFNIVTSGLDLSTAKNKSLVVEKLLKIIAEIKNPVRQAHYMQKLAQLVGVSERTLEAALKTAKPAPVKRREPVKAAASQGTRLSLSRPREEYCLRLLLKHPELKNLKQQPLPEYFHNSENRAVFTAWQETGDISLLRERLDPVIREHLDALEKPELPGNQIEQKYTECVLLLREEFLRSLEIKRGAALAMEAEMGGTAAELAKLKEQGIDISAQLGEVFSQKRGKS